MSQIFAWKSPDQSVGGLLATWPSLFSESGDVYRHGASVFFGRPPYSMTNKGLEFHIQGSPSSPKGLDGETISFQLHCGKSSAGNSSAVTIYVQNFDDSWRRCNCDRLDLTTSVYKGWGFPRQKYPEVLYIDQLQLRRGYTEIYGCFSFND